MSRPVTYRIEKISESWEKRIVANGFIQHREIHPDGSRGPWQFYVSSFDSSPPGQPGMCDVRTSTGLREVPIDAENRIKVNGRWYDRRHWDH